MELSIGKRIAELRKARGTTQDELAEALNVSPQAVSKWENDLSCPDISLLPKLADLFDVSIDELFSRNTAPETLLLPEEKRKDPARLLFRVVVDSGNGDRVRVNLPFPLLKLALDTGLALPNLSADTSSILQGIDFNQLVTLAENGLLGKLVEVDSAGGDVVKVFVE